MAAAAALLWSCESAPERVAIVAHYVPACAPAPSSTPTQLELIALGDFDRSNVSVSILASNAAAVSVGLPPGTRAAELNTLGDSGYWGTGRLDTHNELSILLWPRDRPCPLAQRDVAVTTSASSWSLGVAERSSHLLLLGPVPEDPRRASALSVALSDASASGPAPGESLLPTRSFASLSELGAGFVLAGGIDPESGAVLQTTELFEPRGAGFAPAATPLLLETPRARHAALALPTGSTLLIGGESASGAALRSVEVLSTTPARFVRSLELLETARIQPQALLLDRDRILVGGGFVWREADSASPGEREREPIASVELLSIDLAELSRPSIALEPPALDRAFVGLGPGGALAVGGCEPRSSALDCAPCGDGGCVSRAVWWIDAEGTPYALEPLPVELAAAEPKLVPAAGGAPWLMANGRLGRFDPWRGSFSLTDVVAPGRGRALVGEPRAVGPGLFVWLEADATTLALVGFYHSQRGALTQDVAPLLLGSGDSVVPHRPPTSGASEQDIILRYTPSAGLELFGAAAVTRVADTDYADFTLELSLASGPPPLLRLVAPDGAADDAASFGGLQCPWPDVGAAGTGSREPIRLRAERIADSVRLELVSAVSDPALRPPPCGRDLPERVGVQLVGTRGGTTRITRIDLRRSIEPPSER